MQDAPSVLNPMSERRTTLLGATLTMIGPLSMAIYTPAMPELVHAFGTTDSAIKLTLSLYFAGFACAQLISGPCSDAFGRRAATLSFLAIYLIGSILCAVAPTIDLLLAGRLVQGIGHPSGRPYPARSCVTNSPGQKPHAS